MLAIHIVGTNSGPAHHSSPLTRSDEGGRRSTLDFFGAQTPRRTNGLTLLGTYPRLGSYRHRGSATNRRNYKQYKRGFLYPMHTHTQHPLTAQTHALANPLHTRTRRPSHANGLILLLLSTNYMHAHVICLCCISTTAA